MNDGLLHTLAQHKSIAIDMDDTLVGMPYCKTLRQWIVENHQNHNLWIITFRNNKDAGTVWDELAEWRVPKTCFKGLYNTPQEVWNLANKGKDGLFWQDRNTRKFERYMMLNKCTPELMLEWTMLPKMWKAKVASELGCTLLIDDLEDWVKPGCDAYGVQWLHPNTL